MVIVTVESDLDGFVLRAQQAEEYHLYVNQLTVVGLTLQAGLQVVVIFQQTSK